MSSSTKYTEFHQSWTVEETTMNKLNLQSLENMSPLAVGGACCGSLTTCCTACCYYYYYSN